MQVLDAQRLWHLDNGDGRFFGTITLGYDQLVSSDWLAGVFVDYDFGNGDNHSRIGAIGLFDDVRVSNENNHAWSIRCGIGLRNLRSARRQAARRTRGVPTHAPRLCRHRGPAGCTPAGPVHLRLAKTSKTPAFGLARPRAYCGEFTASRGPGNKARRKTNPLERG